MSAGYDEQNEAVFLRQQAEDAKIAIQQTLGDMRQTVKTAADIRALTRQYPWLVLGATAAAGFMTTRLVLPSAHAQPQATAAPSPKRGSSLSTFVTSSLANIARSAVMSAVASLIHAKAQDESDEDQPMPYDRAERRADEGRREPIP
jgi:hypothetical protein